MAYSLFEATDFGVSPLLSCTVLPITSSHEANKMISKWHLRSDLLWIDWFFANSILTLFTSPSFYRVFDIIYILHLLFSFTGCSPWTLYSNTGYTGACVCYYPKSQSSCEAGIYPDLGYFNGKVSSARKGCYCNYQKYPPLP